MTPEELAAYADTTARALSLPLAPEHRPGVLQYLALAAGFAELVQAVPLSPHDDPAVRFEPVAPAGAASVVAAFPETSA